MAIDKTNLWLQHNTIATSNFWIIVDNFGLFTAKIVEYSTKNAIKIVDLSKFSIRFE